MEREPSSKGEHYTKANWASLCGFCLTVWRLSHFDIWESTSQSISRILHLKNVLQMFSVRSFLRIFKNFVLCVRFILRMFVSIFKISRNFASLCQNFTFQGYLALLINNFELQRICSEHLPTKSWTFHHSVNVGWCTRELASAQRRTSSRAASSSSPMSKSAWAASCSSGRLGSKKAIRSKSK